MEVTYIDHMGNDLTVVNAARVSFNKESTWQIDLNYHDEFTLDKMESEGWEEHTDDGDFFYLRKLMDSDEKLIKYLAKHNHWTPFSHCMISLREKVPIFVARQRFKHMVGFTYNEVSRRYVDDEPEFYVPDAWRKRPQESIKQGSGTTLPKDEQTLCMVLYDEVSRLSKEVYNSLLDRGVAPEQARMVLPQSMYTEYYVTGSLAAFARAYKLRIDPHAQKEIQDLAKQWDKIISPLFPVSWKVLTNDK